MRATVNAATTHAFQKLRGKAQVQVILGDIGGGAPDIDNTVGFFCLPKLHNYTHEVKLAQWIHEGSRERDPKKRIANCRELFGRLAAERYGMSLTELPAVLVQSKDLIVSTNHAKPEGLFFNRLSWAE